jgi:2-keto-4-pentenoate hydratase
MSSREPLSPAVAAGLHRQSAERARLLAAGARPLGWKAGFGTRAAMDKLGTAAPLIGFLTDQTLRPSGAQWAVSAWGNPVLEPEVAVRLGADLAPGADRETAAAAIGEVAVAIELVDIGAADDVEEILAGNIFHRGVLLGAFAPLSPSLRLQDVRLDVLAGGEPHAEDADPAPVLGDLADVVRHMADQAPEAGAPLRAGDVVITGSAIPALPVAGGGRFEVRAAGLEPVAVTLT